MAATIRLRKSIEYARMPGGILPPTASVNQPALRCEARSPTGWPRGQVEPWRSGRTLARHAAHPGVRGDVVPQANTVAGLVAGGDAAVLDGRSADDELAVPGAQERAHRLLDQPVRLAGHQGRRAGQRDRSGAVVRGDGYRVAVSQRGDLARLGQATGPLEVHRGDVDAAGVQQWLETPPAVAGLSGG